MDPSQATVTNDTGSTEPTQDELEWATAADDFVSDSGVELNEKNKEGISNEPTKSEKTPEEIAADEAAAKAKTGDEEQKPGDDPEKKVEGDPEKQNLKTEPTVRDRLVEEAQLRQARDDIAKDVRSKLFDKPTRLEDADGDPIESIADVMKLQNPATGEPFTAEEAASWLLRAQDHFEKQSRADQAEIDKIVETNVTIKYDLEAINEEYGELLKYLPNLRQQLTDAFLKTVETGEDGDTIISTRIGMKEFFDVALAPYVKQVKQLEVEDLAKTEANEKATAEQKRQEQAHQQRQDRSDRGDIFSTKTKIENITDAEEKDWASAAKEYYES